MDVIAKSKCGTVREHAWVDYVCCSDDACSYNQYCSNHNCLLLDCSFIEKAENHRCATDWVILGAGVGAILIAVLIMIALAAVIISKKRK